MSNNQKFQDRDWRPPEIDTDWEPPGVDLNSPSPARVYDYALGGKTHFEVDRELFERIVAIYPQYRVAARANRDFLARAVRLLAEQGISQFVDLGTGIPTSPNVHELARESQPDAAVVYVDHDPVAVAHGRALLADGNRVVAVLHDAREPDALLADAHFQATIDLARPVGLLCVALLHFVDHETSLAMLARYRQVLAPGSAVVVSAASLDPEHDQSVDLDEGAAIARSWGGELTVRSPAQLAELLSGFEIVPPGVVGVDRWPDGGHGEVPHWSAVVGRLGD